MKVFIALIFILLTGCTQPHIHKCMQDPINSPCLPTCVSANNASGNEKLAQEILDYYTEKQIKLNPYQ